MHTSVKLNSPVEFINLEPTQYSPLISKCQIKVLYTGLNRNGTFISKEVAEKMAPSLRGCPIVGYYNKYIEDYEGHEEDFEITEEGVVSVCKTVPFGFVDINAKVWFQKFLDDGANEREYLMTEGYVWTDQFPESERIITKGNNQSMELDEKTLIGEWAKDINGDYLFFIINEALISKLCILGEDVEPCFEGASITSVKFSFSQENETKIFSMFEELKNLCNKGGKSTMTQFNIAIDSENFKAIYDDISQRGTYSIYNAFENEDGSKFLVLKNEDKFYTLDFSTSEEDKILLETEIKETDMVFEASQYSEEEYQNFVDKIVKPEGTENSNPVEEEKVSKEEYEKAVAATEALRSEFDTYKSDAETAQSELQATIDSTKAELDTVRGEYSELSNTYSQILAEVKELRTFKLSAERQEKETMINGFYMLTEEDKKDVIENIDSYSLDEIEAKLSIICVRNKVSFGTETDVDNKTKFTYTGFSGSSTDNAAPAWIQSAEAVAKKFN